jgi:putative tributyrin esterase
MPMHPRVHRAAFVLACVLSHAVTASSIDTLTLNSDLTGHEMRYIVIKPDNYATQAEAGVRFPVVYLLHCAGCDDRYWTESFYADADSAIDDVRFIAVAPFDGGTGGDFRWWLDSPIRAESQLASFVVDELKPAIDTQYATLPDSAHTALCGHSMGGFGSFHLLIEHGSTFGIAVPIKAAVDLSVPHNPNWPGDFNLGTLLGSSLSDSANWIRVNVLRNAPRLKGRHMHLRFYNGRHDEWFYEENERLHTVLDTLGVEHERIVLMEGHTGLAPELMREVFAYIDSLFTLNTAVSRPEWRKGTAGSEPGRSDLRPKRRRQQELFDVRGVRLPASSMAAVGVRIRRHAWGTALEVHL